MGSKQAQRIKRTRLTFSVTSWDVVVDVVACVSRCHEHQIDWLIGLKNDLIPCFSLTLSFSDESCPGRKIYAPAFWHVEARTSGVTSVCAYIA
jgi:hypothetical protein